MTYIKCKEAFRQRLVTFRFQEITSLTALKWWKALHGSAGLDTCRELLPAEGLEKVLQLRWNGIKMISRETRKILSKHMATKVQTAWSCRGLPFAGNRPPQPGRVCEELGVRPQGASSLRGGDSTNRARSCQSKDSWCTISHVLWAARRHIFSNTFLGVTCGHEARTKWGHGFWTLIGLLSNIYIAWNRGDIWQSAGWLDQYGQRNKATRFLGEEEKGRVYFIWISQWF